MCSTNLFLLRTKYQNVQDNCNTFGKFCKYLFYIGIEIKSKEKEGELWQIT